MKAVDDFIQRWEPRHEIGFQGALGLDFRATLGEIFDEIERRAEAKMLEGHKLEGQHYAAMRAIRKELGCERKVSHCARCGERLKPDRVLTGDLCGLCDDDQRNGL